MDSRSHGCGHSRLARHGLSWHVGMSFIRPMDWPQDLWLWQPNSMQGLPLVRWSEQAMPSLRPHGALGISGLLHATRCLNSTRLNNQTPHRIKGLEGFSIILTSACPRQDLGKSFSSGFYVGLGFHTKQHWHWRSGFGKRDCGPCGRS